MILEGSETTRMCPLLQCRGRLRGLHIGGNSSLQGYACSEKFALTEVSTGIPVSLEVSGSNLTSSRRLEVLPSLKPLSRG